MLISIFVPININFFIVLSVRAANTYPIGIDFDRDDLVFSDALAARHVVGIAANICVILSRNAEDPMDNFTTEVGGHIRLKGERRASRQIQGRSESQS